MIVTGNNIHRWWTVNTCWCLVTDARLTQAGPSYLHVSLLRYSRSRRLELWRNLYEVLWNILDIVKEKTENNLKYLSTTCLERWFNVLFNYLDTWLNCKTRVQTISRSTLDASQVLSNSISISDSGGLDLSTLCNCNIPPPIKLFRVFQNILEYSRTF